MHARVTAYRGRLVLELLVDRSIPNEVVTALDRPGNLGHVICDTARNLGVSPEALQLLSALRPGTDSLGDIDWFESGDTSTFGWMGPSKRVALPEGIETSRQWKVGAHLVVLNEVPQGAKDAIDAEVDEPSAADEAPTIPVALASAPAAVPALQRKVAAPVIKAELLQRICRQMELSPAEYRLLSTRLQ